jgi:polysaccharide deacetylase family protein (PEP-CTERM system associated)
MNNALSFDIEDWFQVENLKSAVSRDQWDGMELRVERNTRRILDLLRERQIRATFFILGWIAERCPELVREIDHEGHEIASHGYGHDLVYSLTPEAFRADLLRSKSILEGITGKPVFGYRAPSFSITPRNLWALDVLKETGFIYDSSVFPVSVHDRYGFAGVGGRPFSWPNGLIEIPLSVSRLGRMSFPAAGGGYFRLFPYGYFRSVFSAMNRRGESATFYLHPWELDKEQPRVRIPWFYRFRHYVNLGRTEERLRQLLKDFQFTSIMTAHSIDEMMNAPVLVRPRRRVVFIIDRIGTGQAGTENQLLKIIEGLDPDRFELHLVCLADHPWFSAHRGSLNCHSYIFEVNRFKRPTTYVNFLRLVEMLRSLRADVVHTFFPVGNIVGVLAARMAGVRHVISSRRDYGEWMRQDYLLATRFANRHVERILVNSPRVKELTRRVEKFDPGRIDVILNGIDITRFSQLPRDESLKHELNIDPQKKIVGIVANFRPMKRHETFVHAVREILAIRDDVEFLLLGQSMSLDNVQPKIESLAEKLGVRQRMHFLGSRRDVLRFLSIMDVGVNCSEGEGLSNAIIEYMAVGLPCVVSDSGGNPDLVTNGIHGAVFPLGDAKALASEIMQLLDDSRRREKYARAARRRVEEDLSLPVMIRNFENYYDMLASDGRRSSVDSITGAETRPVTGAKV